VFIIMVYLQLLNLTQGLRGGIPLILPFRQSAELAESGTLSLHN